MKKTLSIITIGAVSLMLSACAGLMGGGNPQITALANTSARISANFVTALDENIASYSVTMEAVGNKTEAERIKSEAENLKDGDNEKIEGSIGVLNEVDISASLENAGELSAEAKALLVDGIVHLGIAIFYDGKVAAEAINVVKEAKDILSNLSGADAMKAGDIKAIISNAQFIADVAPDQLTMMTNSFDALKQYAQAHGIEVPSQEEIEAKASSLARE